MQHDSAPLVNAYAAIEDLLREVQTYVKVRMYVHVHVLIETVIKVLYNKCCFCIAVCVKIHMYVGFY